MNTLTPIKATGAFDYDSFGMLLVGRDWEGGSGYRYGFNGKENVDDVYGNDLALDFGNRFYDARIGRWHAPDKFEAKFKANTTYGYCLNNPIYLIDKNGDDVFIFDSQNKLVAVIQCYTETDIAVQLTSVSVPNGFPVINIDKVGHDAYFVDFSADVTDALGFKDPRNPADLSCGIELVIFMHGPNKYIPYMFAQAYIGVTTPGGVGTSTVTSMAASVGYADLYNFSYKGGDEMDTYKEFSEPEDWAGQNYVTTEIFKKHGKGLSGMYFKFGPTNPLTKAPYWAGHGKTTDGFQIKTGYSTSKFISNVGGKEDKPNKEMQNAIDSWNDKKYGGGYSNSEKNSRLDYLEQTPDRVNLRTGNE